MEISLRRILFSERRETFFAASVSSKMQAIFTHPSNEYHRNLKNYLRFTFCCIFFLSLTLSDCTIKENRTSNVNIF